MCEIILIIDQIWHFSNMNGYTMYSQFFFKNGQNKSAALTVILHMEVILAPPTIS